MAEQDAGRWEEWHYEDEKQGWAIPVVIGTSRPDYPLLHGNREAVLQAVTDHRFAAVAREALKEIAGPSPLSVTAQILAHHRQIAYDVLASLTENTGGE